MRVISLSLSRLASDLEMAGRDLAMADQDDVRRWVGHLRGQPIGSQRLRCHYSALTILYRKTLGRPERVSIILMRRDEPPFRVILMRDDVRRELDSFTVATYRLFFGLIYATGLRISVVVWSALARAFPTPCTSTGGRRRPEPLLFASRHGSQLSDATARRAPFERWLRGYFSFPTFCRTMSAGRGKAPNSATAFCPCFERIDKRNSRTSGFIGCPGFRFT